MLGNNKTKFYVQPLGFLRGCSSLSESFMNLMGSDFYFSAVKLIQRSAHGAHKEEIIYVNKLDEYLNKLPSDEGVEVKTILDKIITKRSAFSLNGNQIIRWEKPVIQAVLNITPDSFSDGGEFYSIDKSSDRVSYLIEKGADIIDVGGESTRPGAQKVSINDELSRVIPLIKKLAKENVIVSIDSRNAEVMREAIKAGAHIVNDVSALSHDKDSVMVVRESNIPVILMHAQGTPETMQKNPHYDNVVLDIYDYLERRIDWCVAEGIKREKIIVDPGIGFGKTVQDNLKILNNISIFHGLGVPLLIGISRKSFIGKITNEEKADKRISGSISAAQVCLDQGVQMVRVHDVEETKQAVAVWEAIRQENNIF